MNFNGIWYYYDITNDDWARTEEPSGTVHYFLAMTPEKMAQYNFMDNGQNLVWSGPRP